MNSFLLILMFFTRINVRKEVDFSEKEFRKGMRKVPLIGIIIGAIMAAVFELCGFLEINGILKGVILFTLYIFLTGALHIDGFSDTADGIYSNRDREKTFEIMKDSRCGAFGVLGMILLSALYISLFSLVPREAVFLFPIFSRTVILFTCRKFDYAKEDGMGKIFMDSASYTSFILSIAILSAVSVMIKGIYILIPVILGFIITEFRVKKISDRLSGITGDILGFSIEYSQIIFLLIYRISEMILQKI